MDRGYMNFNADTHGELYLLHYGIKQCDNSELCGPMMRNMYIIHYVINGCGWFCDGKKKYNVNPGDIFAIYPDDIVSYEADAKKPWLFCFIGFSGEMAERCYNKIGISRSMPVRAVNNLDVAKIINECLDYTDKNENDLSQLRLTGFLYEVLSAFEKGYNKTQKSLSAESRINASILYMECNYHKKISVVDAAKYAGFEYSYFYRVFKRETGINPEKYLINLRIEKAKKLIKNGFAFKEIPILIGIDNIHYFAKLFKNATKMTPSEYRNTIIESYEDIKTL